MHFYISSLKIFILATVVYVLYHVLGCLFKKPKNNSQSRSVKIMRLLLGIYIILIFSVTLFPISSTPDGSIPSLNPMRVNIIPFKTIAKVFSYRLTGLHFFVMTFLKNIAGNVVMFAPFGFLMPMINKKFRKIPLTVGASFLISLFIELVQLVESYFYLAARTSDIDDIILNICGACIGFLVYFLVKKIKQKCIV